MRISDLSSDVCSADLDLKPEPPLWSGGCAASVRARLLELKPDEIYCPHGIRLIGLEPRWEEPAALTARAAADSFYQDMERLLAEADFLAGTYSYADIAFYMEIGRVHV